MKKVLIAGGSGYTGQILVEKFSEKYKTYFTYNSNKIDFGDKIKTKGFKVDFSNGEGIKECLDEIEIEGGGELDIVIYVAALSKPLEAESNHDLTMNVNIPSKIIEEIIKRSWKTYFIFTSSDTVYDGKMGNYNEESECKPVNYYGYSKLEAERYIQEKLDNYAILRLSVILGQNTILNNESRFLSFIINSLKSKKKTSFFHDEYRNFIFVNDIVRVIEYLIENKNYTKLLLNLGGPEKLSRVELAQRVCKFYGFDMNLIDAVSSDSIERGYKSPKDISMDMLKLQRELEIKTTKIEDGLKTMIQC